MRVLLVEDSVRLRKTLSTALKSSGYALDTAEDGEAGLWKATLHDYDVVVLDIMLPKLDGLTLLSRLRAAGKRTPVLFLTAKDSVDDRVQGLRKGADDYLTKPFALEELLARIESLCRRNYQHSNTCLKVDDLELDTLSKTVTRSGQPILMAAREYALLEYLMLRQDQVVSRSAIEEHIYDDVVSPMSNVVDSAICSLRKLLATSQTARPIIHTRRGQGYIIYSKSEGA